MSDKLTGSKFGRHMKLIVMACTTVLFIAVLYASLQMAYNADVRSHGRLAQQSTQKINEKVTLAIGTLFSMVAVHQTSPDGFDHRQFEMFAENLVSKQFAITAAGRFDQILHDDLDYYSAETQSHGLLSFAPSKLDNNGEIVPSEQKPKYQSLISFVPQNPVSAGFIGLDLSEHPRSKMAIDKSVESYASFPATLPQQWVAEGQLNIFVPSFYGHYIPEKTEDRQLQTDGGYFITLDLEKITAQSTSASFPLSVNIALDALDYNPLVKQPSHVNQDNFATSIFKSRSIKHRLTIGAESATIMYNTPAGVTGTQIISALSKALAALLIFCILLAVRASQRATRAQILANKKEIARERKRALVTLSSVQDAVITTDFEDNIDYLNPAALDTLKVKKEDLIGLPLQDMLDQYFREETIPASGTVSKKNFGTNTSLMRLKGDESQSTGPIFNCNSSAIVNSHNAKIGTVLTMRDMSKEHALTTELAYQATHDALTGLPNRRQFESVLTELLETNASESQSNIVGYIDLDQFKLINDTVGHAAGDKLLKKLAYDLQSLVPENVEVARLGGDEFGFICTAGSGASENNVSCDESIARLFYEFFQSYVYHTNDQVFAIRASIGISNVKPHHININDVLSEVDIACYTAKDQGRNGYVIYDADDKDTKAREGEMLYLPLLQSALKENRFVLYTQPIVSTQGHNKAAHHYECLIRLINDEGEIITPYKFIVAAERYDLITDIDRWVIEAAFQQISEFQGTALQGTIFSINLSGQSAVDATMPGFIDEMLQKYQIDAAKICFELTETAVISNMTQAQKLIALLRNRGCTIALDDFGAGASSFGYLKNLEVDYLKIDGQFVKEMISNKVDFEMVRSMNNVGEALGIKTIAEFVESKEIMQALGGINVDFAQGYYIGKPEPMAELLNDDSIQTAA